MLKSHGCGELRAEHVGQAVTLAGWVHRRRDHGGLIFLDLRDSTGLVQVVCHPEQAEAFATAEGVRSEYVLQIAGSVIARRDGTENPEMPTGAIEVTTSTLAILNASETPPFPVNQDANVSEEMRLRFRYLDLRREHMARNLRLRHQVVKSIRDFMDRHDFIEVETPVLGAATPEGARDYLVPSRVHPGSFYALPQSPQQYKQLLMVAGVDRYFQIARCYRDEDLRADRQPEFTQLDVEMAFVEKDDILDLMEELYLNLAKEVGPQFTVPFPFPRLTYAEAMERWGSDKPDLRYGMEITNLTDHVRDTEFQVFRGAIEAGGRVRAIAVPGAGDLPRREVDRLVDLARENGAKGLVWVQFSGEGALEGLTEDDVKSPVNRFFTPEQLGALGRASGAARGDMLLIAADTDAVTSRVLDAVRRQMAERLELAEEDLLAFCFVSDFPMFERDEERGGWTFAHNPFAMPHAEDIERLESDPASAMSHAYDIVCNGQEIGSGSIRIHDAELQLRVFEMLGIDRERAWEQFGHMLTAFTYGAPPHGGIATGIDRTAALFAGERDIRELIAFPKTKSAADPMTGAPAPVGEQQLIDVHIELRPDALAPATEDGN